jgi:hypothetical protein
MATTLQKGLFGGDPVAMQAEQQKIWNQLYGQAGSPYEKMGIALGQLGGTLFGGESTMSSKTTAINKALENAAALYQQGTPEYYKAVAEDPALANYADSKEFATQKYLEAKKAESLEFAAERKGVREDPGSVDVYAPKYATTLLNKARAKGFDPTTEAVPETTEEIKAFAKLYALDTDPAYNKFMTLRTLSEKEAKNEQVKAEKDVLSLEQIRVNIKKDNAQLAQIGKDDFDKGARWNAENAAARQFLESNKVDLTKPLTGAARANPAFVEAYQKALRNDWTGSKGVTSPAPKGDTKMTPIALPPLKSQAVIGQVYITPNGDAQWDGSKFNIVAK